MILISSRDMQQLENVAVATMKLRKWQIIDGVSSSLFEKEGVNGEFELVAEGSFLPDLSS